MAGRCRAGGRGLVGRGRAGRVLRERENVCQIMYNLKATNWIWTKRAVQLRIINRIVNNIQIKCSVKEFQPGAKQIRLTNSCVQEFTLF